MIESPVLDFLAAHAHQAHWLALGGILLAGLNFPVSLDLVTASCALLAATVAQDHLPHLFLAVLVGCIASASLTYWIGRLGGERLLRLRIFRSIMSEERILRMRRFYEKRGLLAFLVGRFIPFGVRNCLFLSSGMSRLPYSTFLARDALASSVWSISFFSLFYLFGRSYSYACERMIHNIGMILETALPKIVIAAFLVTGIAILWYNRPRR